MNFLRKTTQQIKSKVTKYEISQDQEYDALYSQYKDKKKVTKSLEGNIQMFQNQMKGLSKTLKTIAQDFAKSFPPTDQTRGYIAQMHEVVTEFEKTCIDNFAQEVEMTCNKPLKNYLGAIENCQKCIEKRNADKIRYDEHQNTYKKYLDRPPTDPSKMTQAQHDLKHHTDIYNFSAQQAKKQLFDVVHSNEPTKIFAAITEATGKVSQGMHASLGKLTEIGQRVRNTLQEPPQYMSNNVVQPITMQQTTTGGTSSTIPADFDTEWYYLDQTNQQAGPLHFAQFSQKYKSGEITDTTNVFGGNLDHWKPLSAVQGNSTSLKQALFVYQ